MSRTPPRKVAGGLAALVAALAGALQMTPAARQARADRAHADSFPTYEVRFTRPARDSTLGTVLPIGQTMTGCVFARNRYTGEGRQMVDRAVSDAQAAQVAIACDSAFQAWDRERGG